MDTSADEMVVDSAAVDGKEPRALLTRMDNGDHSLWFDTFTGFSYPAQHPIFKRPVPLGKSENPSQGHVRWVGQYAGAAIALRALDNWCAAESEKKITEKIRLLEEDDSVSDLEKATVAEEQRSWDELTKKELREAFNASLRVDADDEETRVTPCPEVVPPVKHRAAWDASWTTDKIRQVIPTTPKKEKSRGQYTLEKDGVVVSKGKWPANTPNALTWLSTVAFPGEFVQLTRVTKSKWNVSVLEDQDCDREVFTLVSGTYKPPKPKKEKIKKEKKEKVTPTRKEKKAKKPRLAKRRMDEWMTNDK